MHTHTAQTEWQRGEQPFLDLQYSRAHRWRFDGGVEVPASASPALVPPPGSVAAAVDPEEALVAALSSCHLLSFLAVAARRGFVVDAYLDRADGELAREAGGVAWVKAVRLQPEVRFAPGRGPDPATHLALHHQAHRECVLAASVRSEVRCEPRLWSDAGLAAEARP